MVFENLSVFQNILFLLACVGVILLATYLICLASGIKHSKKNLALDEIDNPLENHEVTKFVFNAFALKGSILFWAVSTSLAFMLSMFITPWIALVIGIVISAGVVIFAALISKEKPSVKGEIAIVSEDITQETAGSVILLEDGMQLKAKTSGKPIKKGKKVVVIEHIPNGVIVKKFKRHHK